MPERVTDNEVVQAIWLRIRNSQADLEDFRKFTEAFMRGELQLNEDQIQEVDRYAQARLKDMEDLRDSLVLEQSRRAKKK